MVMLPKFHCELNPIEHGLKLNGTRRHTAITALEVLQTSFIPLWTRSHSRMSRIILGKSDITCLLI